MAGRAKSAGKKRSKQDRPRANPFGAFRAPPKVEERGDAKVLGEFMQGTPTVVRSICSQLELLIEQAESYAAQKRRGRAKPTLEGLKKDFSGTNLLRWANDQRLQEILEFSPVPADQAAAIVSDVSGLSVGTVRQYRKESHGKRRSRKHPAG